MTANTIGKATGLIFLVLLGMTDSASAVSVSALALQGGDKGLALVIDADAVLSGTTVNTSVRSLSANTTNVIVTITGVSCGLGVRRYTELPDGSPVSEILIREREGHRALEIEITLHTPVLPEVVAKVKDTRVVVALSKEAVKRFTWVSPGRKPDGAALAAVVSAQNAKEWTAGAGNSASADAKASGTPSSIACLRDISVVVRGGIAQLHFEFSAPVVPRARMENGRAVLLFAASANCLAEHRLDPPVESAFRSIEFRQRAQGGVDWVGAIVTLADSGSDDVFIRTDGNRTTLAVLTGEHRFAVWHSQTGAFASSDFSKVLWPAVVEQPVVSAPAAVSAPVPAVVKPLVTAPVADTVFEIKGYLVAVGDNVNVRSSPSAGNENVVARLARGESVAFIGEQGPWKRIQTLSKTRGWVYSSLVVARSEYAERVEEPPLALPKAPGKTVSASMLPAIGALTSAAGIAQAPGAPAASQAQRALPPGTTVPTVEQVTGHAKADAPLPPPPKGVAYEVLGRDPFVPYSRRIDEGFPSVENLKLVGILYDRVDRIALLEDDLFKDKAYALREQEPVSNGVVWRVNPTNVVFLITELGVSRAVTLELRDVSPTKVQAKRGRS